LKVGEWLKLLRKRLWIQKRKRFWSGNAPTFRECFREGETGKETEKI
jgi:hypothetical protein